jgi:hypothetical protein
VSRARAFKGSLQLAFFKKSRHHGPMNSMPFYMNRSTTTGAALRAR